MSNDIYHVINQIFDGSTDKLKVQAFNQEPWFSLNWDHDGCEGAKEAVMALMNTLGAKLIRKDLTPVADKLPNIWSEEFVYIWADGVCSFTLYASSHNVNAIRLWTKKEEQIKDFLGILAKFSQPPPKHGNNRQPAHAYVLVKPPMGGFQLISLGFAGQPFRTENYMPDIAGAFHTIVEDIKRPIPRGRLSVLEGPPGTGKTHFIQALMNACPGSKFVVLPAAMLESFEDPNSILAYLQQAGLLRMHDDDEDDFDPDNDSEKQAVEGVEENHPLVLIIEDADKALGDRNVGSANTIASLLNLSDGILGKMINLRIVCTTNSKLGKEFDPAVMRKGRLTCCARIGNLSYTQAQLAFNKIIERDDVDLPVKDSMPLANVYDFAKSWLEENNK